MLSEATITALKTRVWSHMAFVSSLVLGVPVVQSANEVIITMIGELDEPDALPRSSAAPSLQAHAKARSSS